MNTLSRSCRALLCALLTASLLLSPAAALFAGVTFAETEEEGVLFATSFENDETPLSGELLEAENVVKIEYGIAGKGLEVRLDTVAGSEDYIGSENKFNLFDGKTSTKFLTGSATSVVWFSLKEPAAVKVYEIASANDAPERDPKDWTLYGSTDGKKWVQLDRRTNVTFVNRFQTNKYEIDNNAAYIWYKLDITKNAGSDMTQYSTLELYTADPGTQTDPGTAFPEDPFEVVKASVKGTDTVSAAEGREMLFDGEEATKATFIGKTAWVSFKVSYAETVLSYAVTTANDAPMRDPKDWTLYGSKNGRDWTEVDSRTDVSYAGRFEEQVFELSEPAAWLWYKFEVTKNCGADDYTQFSELKLLTAESISDGEPGMTVKKDFGPMQTDNGKAGAWTGTYSLAVFGGQTQKTDTRARTALFDGLHIPVTEKTTLSYVIFPGLFKLKAYDYEYTSCRVIVDLHFTDGTYLSSLGARDQNGSVMSPDGQVAGECLYTSQWNYIESDIGSVAAGRTIDRIDVFFEMKNAEGASKFITFFDDLKIENKTPQVYEHLSDYINILRGTNNDGAFSRGLCTPGVTVPNGFNFYSPVTEPSKSTASYNYQVNGSNNPLDSITVIHIPSNWLSSYGTWQFMPNTSMDLNSPTAEQLSGSARASKFKHENEIARAHYYSVTLDEGSAASGVKIEITPTSHAAYVRITFPESAGNVNLIFDSLWGSGSLKFSEDGKSFNAITSHTAAGNTRMYVYGEFDIACEKSSVVSSRKGAAVFPKGTTVLNMKISTSFISAAQAIHSLDLEIGDKGFEDVFAEAQSAWDELCGKFEIEGANYTQLVNFYSSVYRAYAYPNLYSENEGSNEEPVWVYASPYKSGKKTSGILYTVNGFWDTYRTTWAAYSLFTAEKDGELLDGLVQHYIDSGWIPRWICPGGVDCMVGTSSDIIFADAYVKGIDFNYQKAWESMIENASAYSANMSAGGRPDNNLTPYLGYVANTTTQGFSSSIESYINDYGLYRMAEKMGLTAEAEYYRNRCMKYPELFNADVGFFMGKNVKGTFSAKKSNYDPTTWGGPKEDYTESVGWVNAFPAVFDPEGLVDLYGGREALAAKLNEMFDDSPAAMRKVVADGVHEIAEFKEVKMGQYEHNNQPSHHIIYTYAFSSEPWHVQEYTREVLRHVYVGAEIGQGFPGDEDNGEMSAWYIFNALGFYPYCLASGEYVIGSPLFDKVTVHLDNGNDLVIVAHNNSQENVYIQSATVNGESYDKLYLTHEMLTSGCTIVYEMGSEPSDFGCTGQSRPSSLTNGKIEAYKKDVTDGAKLHAADYDGSRPLEGKHVYTKIEGAAQLFDGNSLTYTTIADGDSVVFTSDGTAGASVLTLTAYDKTHAPSGVTVEVSNDGAHFKTVYKNDALSFKFGKFVAPYALPENERGKYYIYRVTLTGGTRLSEIELIGGEEALGQSDIDALTAYLSADARTRAQTPAGSLFSPDVTLDARTLKNLTYLLNLTAGKE